MKSIYSRLVKCLTLSCFIAAAAQAAPLDGSELAAAQAAADLTVANGGSPLSNPLLSGVSASAAFDNTISGSKQDGRVISAIGEAKLWVTYTFDSPTVVNSYSVQIPKKGGYYITDRAPASFTVYGTNEELSDENVDDSSIWTNLCCEGEFETVSDWAQTTSGDIRYFRMNTDEVPYKSYKFSATGGDKDGYVQITELQFFNAQFDYRSVFTFSQPEDGSLTVTDSSGTLLSPGSHTYQADDVLSVSVSPTPGKRFVYWLFSGVEVSDMYAESISVTLIEKASSVTPVFIDADTTTLVQYVSVDGLDNRDGLTEEMAKASPKAAIEFLDPVLTGHSDLSGLVYVAPGTYESFGNTLTNAISVVGTGSTPEEVILKNSSKPNSSQKTKRIFTLDHEKAFVSSMTLIGGGAYQTTEAGGGASIRSNGGTVSNCVVSACYGMGHSSTGAGVYINSEKGLVTHCVIRDCYVEASPGSWEDKNTRVGGAFVKAGRIENSLVYNCYTQTYSEEAVGITNKRHVGGVFVYETGKVINCTILDCIGGWGYASGLYASDSAEVYNTIAVCGRTTDENGVTLNATAQSLVIDSTSNASVFNCATDSATAVGENGIAVSAAAAFEKYSPTLALEEMSLIPAGELVNGGLLDIAEYTHSPVELLGERRVIGPSVDIGCYELDTSAMATIIILR